MRRRNLLENAAKLTLSIQTITVEPSASTFTFYAMWNGTNISSSSTLSVTYDGTVISGRSIASDGTITANSTQYTATTDDRNGYLEVTYSGQTARVDVTQKKDYVVSASTKVTYGSVSIYNIVNVSSINIYPTGDSLCNDYDIEASIYYFGQRVTKKTTRYYDNYASGRQVQTNKVTSDEISATGNYTNNVNMGVTSTDVYNAEGHTLSKSIGGKSFLIDGTGLSLDDTYHEFVRGTLYVRYSDILASKTVVMCF